MENVEGLLLGNAWKYVQEIYKQFNDIGYKLHHWLLKGEEMGVPQTRHRVIFVAIREDIGIEPKTLDMFFNYEPITYGDIKEGVTRKIGENTETYYLLTQQIPSDKSIADINERVQNKLSGFQTYLIDDNSIIPTLRAKPDIIDRNEYGCISGETIRNSQTFPMDYDFGGNSISNIGYITGMSVPPIMIKRVVQRLIEQGVYDYKLKEME